jgi:hypothetical protein
MASALSASQRIPGPFSRAVSALQVASVGPLPICQPLARAGNRCQFIVRLARQRQPSRLGRAAFEQPVITVTMMCPGFLGRLPISSSLTHIGLDAINRTSTRERFQAKNSKKPAFIRSLARFRPGLMESPGRVTE